MNRFTLAMLLIFMSLLLIVAYVVLHEHTHQALNRYDFLESEIRIDSSGIYTEVTSEGVMSAEVKLAHMFNEVIGYNVMPFLLLLCVLVFSQLVEVQR